MKIQYQNNPKTLKIPFYGLEQIRVHKSRACR
jgi:hypothetical protein